MKLSLKEQFKIWSKVAAQSFGGPAGQISVIHQLIVEEKKIISEKRFLHALNFCMLLPGPEAQQLATYMGWVIDKWRGGLIAGGLFILPGFLSILFLSFLYVLYNDVSFVQGIFYGIKPAVIAIVLSALYKISQKSLVHSFHWALAFMGFVLLFFFNFPFPLVVLGSAFLGIIYGKFYSHQQDVGQMREELRLPPFNKTILTLLTWLIVWFTPLVLTLLIWGRQSTFHTLNIFFSKMSLVTFGGAYAALSYVAQLAVESYGWLQGTEMLDGLALAETTPGPLIQVVQYVGFMGAYRFPQEMNPLLSGFIGSVLTTWMTFAPCFLFIFTLAPYVEYIRGKKIFSDALSAITASVVGVILNLSLWFVLQSLFQKAKKVSWGPLDFEYPVLSSVDFMALFLCLLALIMKFQFQKSLYKILGACTLLGILYQYLT